jgi:16S rRNA (uracil1498-N3)-methyltransferase
MPGFYTPELLPQSKQLDISGNEHHHIVHVFRKQINDEILLTNGQGVLASAKIIAIGKKNLQVEILEISQPQNSQPSISVALPLLKNKHDNLIVEKLTELGVREFYPILTERTIRKAHKNICQKFEKVAIAAIKQCDNAYLPKIHQPVALSELLAQLPAEVQPIAALEFGQHPLISQVVAPQTATCLIIGPEGGFSPAEAKFMLQNRVKAITLGNHILRAETAAITAVSQLLSCYLRDNPAYY